MALFLLSSVETRPIQTTFSPPQDQYSNQFLSGFSSPYLHEEDGCKGLESEENCLIRRSMAAHTDYIYTQDIHGNP
ncbi:Phytosulfokine [Parasponia andersonii]|uniref:Phytosulfokine n=1 Tax=Parasponia andersonii TaxID=3476 RepID=A0A2P5DMU6_PARAD|nr:Phytosulfokine [Parasponia andersonii]